MAPPMKLVKHENAPSEKDSRVIVNEQDVTFLTTVPGDSFVGSSHGTDSGGTDKDVAEKVNEKDPYSVFISSSENLETKLQDFSQEVLKLGSAFWLSRSAIGVRQGLASMRSQFEADALRSREPEIREENTAANHKNQNRRAPKGTKKKSKENPGGPLAQKRETNLSVSLLKISSSLKSFSTALTAFNDYYEQKTYSAIDEFRSDILILSEALAYFNPDGDTPEVKTFIKGRLLNASSHFDKATEALLRFVQTGMPCIDAAQNRVSSMMLNASTVATFFAGVTATALQYTGIDIGTTIGRAVQTLWFSSLVLSIGSAVTSLLVLAWRQAVFSRTQRVLPLYVRFWMRSGYLVLLSASIIAFISGLVTYVYALQKTKAMFWVVTACTAFCAISLANALLYFGIDRWVFSKSIKSRSLARILNPEKQSRAFWEQLKFVWPLVSNHVRQIHWYTRNTTRDAKTSLSSAATDILSCLGIPCSSTRGSNGDVGGDLENRLTSEGITERNTEHQEPDPDARVNAINISCYSNHIRSLSPQLLDTTARIYDMQFSPNGEWLAVCTTYWCYIIDVRPESDRVLDLLFYLVRQVKWSQNGQHLLTRTGDDIQIWHVQDNSSLMLEHVVKPGKSLVDVEWIDDKKFVALSNDAESLYIVHMDINEPVEIRLLPSGLTIYEMTTMAKSDLIIFLATRKVKGLPKEEGISCIIVYDVGTDTFYKDPPPIRVLEKSGTIISKVPLLKKAKGLAAGAKRTRLVVTYEGSLPEVWSIDGKGSISMKCELTIPESRPKGVWGSASFVGRDDNVVACAEDGVVHFWRDTTGDFGFQYFHSLPIHDGDGSDVSEDKDDNNSDNDSDDGKYDDSDDDSDDGIDDDDKREETVFAWMLKSGMPTMASAYLGLLREWSPKGPEAQEDNTVHGYSRGN